MPEYLHPTEQYGDLIGTVSVDEADGENLLDLAKKKGIDTDRYFPIGIDYYRESMEQLRIVAVDREIADTFDACEKYAASHGGDLPGIWFAIDCTLEELFGYFQRFGLTLQRRFKVERIARTEDHDLTKGG